MLIAARQKRLALAGLPAEVTPDNLADVQRVINAVSARIESPVRGWKTYCLYKPMQLVSVVGCHPIDNPVLPVVAGVNRLRRHQGVKAGAIMITSSSTSFLPVAAGAEIRAVYEGLGEVRARFSPT